VSFRFHTYGWLVHNNETSLELIRNFWIRATLSVADALSSCCLACGGVCGGGGMRMQVSTDDVQADGCAAKYYHEAMAANNATSELHLIPLDKQRCYAVGQTDDPAAKKVRKQQTAEQH